MENTSIVNKDDPCYRKFKSSELETDKDIFRATKQFLKIIIQKKKRIFLQDKMQKNLKNYKELWNTLKSLGLNSKKTVQSKISLKEDDVIQFEPKMIQILLKPFILIWQETYTKNHQSFLSNLIQKNLRCSTKH